MRSLLPHLLVLCAALLLAGCQQKLVFLMPPPAILQPGTRLFQLTEIEKYDNVLMTLYATNRVPFPLPDDSDHYSIFPSDDLRLGWVALSVGEEGTSWEEFHRKSLERERVENLLVSFDSFKEVIHVEEDQPISRLRQEREAVNRLNDMLRRTVDKDITIYVHGANSNMYRATAQGAQYFHFTGHNSVVLTYSWPSAENILKYKTDVLHANKTVPVFSRLIEFLATHTIARHINILAYSAGTQVVAPALVQLRQNYARLTRSELRQKLRLGEIYFAAPDIEFRSFAQRYSHFRDLVQRVTISANTRDSVLSYARFHSGKSRLGQPNPREISEVEHQLFIDSSRSGVFDILDLQGSPGLSVGKAHNFWYAHPWISSDLLLLMLFNLSPEKRGLTRFIHDGGLVTYHFPEDYEQKITGVVEELESWVQPPNHQTPSD